jgi:hypothetical protein
MNNLTPEALSLSEQLGMQAKEALPRRGTLGKVLPQQNRIHFFDSSFEEGHTYYFQDASQNVAIKLVFYPTEAPQASIGLAESLKGRVGISAYVTEPVPRNEVPPRPSTYLKNGILVSHAGRRITSADVANALAEE